MRQRVTQAHDARNSVATYHTTVRLDPFSAATLEVFSRHNSLTPSELMASFVSIELIRLQMVSDKKEYAEILAEVRQTVNREVLSIDIVERLVFHLRQLAPEDKTRLSKALTEG